MFTLGAGAAERDLGFLLAFGVSCGISIGSDILNVNGEVSLPIFEH